MFLLNNKTTGENYVAETTLEPGVLCRLVNITVLNAAVYYQLKVKTEPGVPNSAWEWTGDIFCPPTFQSLQRETVGVRFKSANKLAPAQVTAQLLTPLDLGMS